MNKLLISSSEGFSGYMADNVFNIEFSVAIVTDKVLHPFKQKQAITYGKSGESDSFGMTRIFHCRPSQFSEITLVGTTEELTWYVYALSEYKKKSLEPLPNIVAYHIPNSYEEPVNIYGFSAFVNEINCLSPVAEKEITEAFNSKQNSLAYGLIATKPTLNIKTLSSSQILGFVKSTETFYNYKDYKYIKEDWLTRFFGKSFNLETILFYAHAKSKEGVKQTIEAFSLAKKLHPAHLLLIAKTQQEYDWMHRQRPINSKITVIFNKIGLLEHVPAEVFARTVCDVGLNVDPFDCLQLSSFRHELVGKKQILLKQDHSLLRQADAIRLPAVAYHISPSEGWLPLASTQELAEQIRECTTYAVRRKMAKDIKQWRNAQKNRIDSVPLTGVILKKKRLKTII